MTIKWLILVFLLVLSSSVYGTYTSDLIAYYPNDWIDYTEIYNGTNTGSVNGSGYIGDARVYDGNDYISLPEAVLEDTDFTVNVWAYPTDGDAGSHMAVSSTTGNRMFLGVDNDLGYWRVMDCAGGAFNATEDSKWSMLTITFDKATLTAKVYYNGTLGDTQVCTATGDPTSMGIGVYDQGTSDYFIGTIDEVAFWDTDMSASDIKSMYDDYVAGLLINESAPTTAKTLYIDPDSIGGACSDVITRAANNITNPFCGLQRALNTMTDGDIIDLRGGNHSQTKDLAGSSQVGGFEYTSLTTWTNSLKIFEHTGETAILTSQIDGSTAGTWVYSSGIWRLPYEGYNEYMRFFLRNATLDKKYELLGYDDDVGDMDSYADMADSTNPYGCYVDETANDYIECRLPSGVSPNTAGTLYFTNTTTTLFLDNQYGAGIVIANLTVEPAGRAGIYITDGENAIIERNEFYGGLWAIRYARFDNMTIRHNYALQDYYQDEMMAWDEHRKSETAETDFVHCDDDPTNTNISFNYIEGWFNGLLLYNQDGDSGVNGLYIGDNNFSRIYDDSIEVEEDGYTSHHTRNRFNNTFIGFSFHPYDDPTHSTLVDYNYYYNPMYNLFYKGGTYYYGEAVKQKSSSDYMEGVNFKHNTFLGTGVAANSGQTNTQFYNNWTDNIFKTTASSQYLITTTGEEADNVFYDYNLYYSTNYYFRYYGSDSISTIYYDLATAIATGRLASSNANSIDADPLLNSDGVPLATSPVCGAASDSTYIGAFACAVSPANVTVTITNPTNNTVTGEEYPIISWETSRLSNCTFLRWHPDYFFGFWHKSYYYNIPANITQTNILSIPSMQVSEPDLTYFYITVECTYQYYSVDDSGTFVMYIDTNEPIATLTYPNSTIDIRKTTGEQWINLNGSCYDQTLDNAQIYVVNSTGGWYYSDNQTGLDALNVTTYSWDVNVSMATWTPDEYTVIVNCSDVPAGNDHAQTTFDFQTNATMFVYNSVYGYISDWQLNVSDGNTYNITGTNTTVWLDTNTNYTFSGYDNLFDIVPRTVQINYTNTTLILQTTKKTPSIGACSGYRTFPILNISFFNEQTDASINVNSGYEAYVYDGTTNHLYNFNYTNLPYNTICVDIDPAVSTIDLLFYGQIILEKTDYNTKVIHIPYTEGFDISNNPYTNLSLYLLPIANSTTMTYNWYTTSFAPVNGNMLIYRCELDGTKTLIDAPLISDGVATSNLEAFSTAYSYEVVIDGVTYTDNSYNDCHVESTTERTFYVDITVPALEPLIELHDTSCLVYKSDVDEITMSWDADTTIEGCIEAYRTTVTGSVKIYESCVNASSTTITRTITNNTNTYIVKGYLSNDDITVYCQDTIIVTVQTDAGSAFGVYGAFAVGFLILAFVLLLSPDGQLQIISAILALMVSFGLGFIAFGWGAVVMLICFLLAALGVARYKKKQ